MFQWRVFSLTDFDIDDRCNSDMIYFVSDQHLIDCFMASGMQFHLGDPCEVSTCVYITMSSWLQSFDHKISCININTLQGKLNQLIFHHLIAHVSFIFPRIWDVMHVGYTWWSEYVKSYSNHDIQMLLRIGL